MQNVLPQGGMGTFSVNTANTNMPNSPRVHTLVNPGNRTIITGRKILDGNFLKNVGLKNLITLWSFSFKLLLFFIT